MRLDIEITDDELATILLWLGQAKSQLEAKHDFVNSQLVSNFQKKIKEGIKENKCDICEITEWNGKPISMQLDHIDGNSHNHKLENLRMICPNCHTQTENWGINNISKDGEKRMVECGLKNIKKLQK